MKDGGPAFPRPLSKLSAEEISSEQEGMSLRDYFAGQALVNFRDFFLQDESSIGKGDAPTVAEMCYVLADAMLAAREKSP